MRFVFKTFKASEALWNMRTNLQASSFYAKFQLMENLRRKPEAWVLTNFAAIIQFET